MGLFQGNKPPKKLIKLNSDAQKMLFGKNTVDKESAMLGRDASEREVTRFSEEGRRRRIRVSAGP